MVKLFRMLPRIKILFFLLIPISLFAQEEEEEKNWRLNGYLKDMVSINVLADSTLVDNLVHNRLNFEWFPKKELTVYVGMRNRLLTGDLVKAIPNYADFIDTNNDYFDLSITWMDRNNAVLHSVFDRAYVKWIKGDWEISAGRQRINWGINTVWNPNDLYNAYSFFDFDYEERPGSDALRVVKYFGFASSLEVAYNLADNIDKSVASAMWKFNKGGYDFQVFSGIARGDFVTGLGWAGNIGNAGFKGEATYFTPYNDRPGGYESVAVSLGVDYSFANSLYLIGSYLYNDAGQLELISDQPFLFSNQNLSAKNLMPFKHSAFINGSYQFHPLLSGGMAIMAFPGDNSTFLNPSITWSILQSLDLSGFGQFFLDDKDTGGYGSISKSIFFRLKYSF